MLSSSPARDTANARPRKAGRGAARRAAFVKAAAEVFLEQGFGAATLDEVVRRAGGSRATLYAQFGNKEGLFAAIIDEQCGLIVEPLLSVGLNESLETTLYAIGRRFMDVLMHPRSLALYRMVIGESARFPDLGRQVFKSGPEAAAEHLNRYLRAQMKAGNVHVADPGLAARHFLEMVKGDLHTRALFNVGAPPAAREIDRCVKEAVRIFIEGGRRRHA